MARKTFGEGLGARPSAAEANIGDIFTDTSTNITYTFDDGEWKTVPVAPEHNLPEVTSADNGKVLKVVEGGWAAAVHQSGADPDIIGTDKKLSDLSEIALGYFDGTQYVWDGDTTGKEYIEGQYFNMYKISDDTSFSSETVVGSVIKLVIKNQGAIVGEYNFTITSYEQLDESAPVWTMLVDIEGDEIPAASVLTETYQGHSAGLYLLGLIEEGFVEYISEVNYGTFHKISNTYLDGVVKEGDDIYSDTIYSQSQHGGSNIKFAEYKDSIEGWELANTIKLPSTCKTPAGTTAGMVLTANGTGSASWQSSSGGATLYRHSVSFIANSTQAIRIQLYNTSSTDYTLATLKTAVGSFPVSTIIGRLFDNSTSKAYVIVSAYYNTSDNQFVISYIGDNASEMQLTVADEAITNFGDNAVAQ